MVEGTGLIHQHYTVGSNPTAPTILNIFLEELLCQEQSKQLKTESIYFKSETLLEISES